MLKAAVAARGNVNLLGVTVLTSREYPGYEQDVLNLAKLAQNCGLQGIVCSVPMAKLLKENIKRLFFVCPGIRLDETKDDQKQTATPCEAKAAGVDYIVVGRPVIKASAPAQAAEDILREISP